MEYAFLTFLCIFSAGVFFTILLNILSAFATFFPSLAFFGASCCFSLTLSLPSTLPIAFSYSFSPFLLVHYVVDFFLDAVRHFAYKSIPFASQILRVPLYQFFGHIIVCIFCIVIFSLGDFLGTISLDR